MNKRLVAKLLATAALSAATVVLAVVGLALGRAVRSESDAAGAAVSATPNSLPAGLTADGVRISGGSAQLAYLQALALEQAAAKIDPAKHQGESNSAFASADTAAQQALELPVTYEQRSQLLNLLAVDELGEANADFGNEARLHKRAAWNLQQAVMFDRDNNDAKYNLEVLMTQDPQSTRKQPQPQPNKPGSKKKPPHSSSGNKPSKAKRGANLTLGGGY